MNRADKIAVLQAIANGKALPTDLEPPVNILAIQDINGQGWNVNGQPMSHDEYRQLLHSHHVASQRRAAIGQQAGYFIKVVYGQNDEAK